MKKLYYLFIILLACCQAAMAQGTDPDHSKIPAGTVYNTAYIKALYAKYSDAAHLHKSSLCKNCLIWTNPYYTSIADTQRHMPICEKAVVTKAHRVMQEALYATDKSIRSGAIADWYLVGTDADVRPIYGLVNDTITKAQGKTGTVFEVVYGHCCLCYVLAGWSKDAMALSDAVDFNAGMQIQAQNIGTQIAAEDTTRLLIGWVDPQKHKVNIVDSVTVWGGCYADKNARIKYQKDKTGKKVIRTLTVPDVYWRVIKFGNQTVCYWMPNLVTEVKSLLPRRHITYKNLVAKLGFDPEKVLP